MLKARNIVKSFGATEILHGVDIDVTEREVVALTGPSGAGKTTLLQILGTLDRPDSGSVSYDGRDILGLGTRQQARFRNRSIGFVFQFHRLLPEFTLLENVMMPALIGGASRKEARRRAMPLIDYLGIAARADHKPDALSGGERQRAAVARALVNGPRLVLADEPSGNLDSHNRHELHRLFFDLRRDMGHSFLIVTHDDALAREADRTVHMRDGHIESITVNDTMTCAD